MEWNWEGAEDVLLGDTAIQTMRSPVKLKIGGLTGVFVSLIRKRPPDSRYWIVKGDLPAFVRFEGAMFLNRPVWRLEMTTVEWPKQQAAADCSGWPSQMSAAAGARRCRVCSQSLLPVDRLARGPRRVGPTTGTRR